MKHTKFLIVLSAILSIAFVSCKVTETETEYVPEIEYVPVTEEKDTIAPSNVTNFTATAVGTKVLLTWTDATDDDIFGYEVSYSGSSAINRAALSSAMDSNTILVAPGSGGTYISNLTVGNSYTFTVKTMDTSGNKSTGVTSGSVGITSESSPLEITLTPSTTETTNQDVSVGVNVATTDSVKKISYARGLSYKTADVLESGTDITSTSSFTVSENGSFTVAASDSDGRREITWISISNIDKTAPAVVTNLAATYGRSTVTVTWTASASSDVDYYLVSYSVDGTAQKTDKQVRTTSYLLSNVASASETYKFTVKTVDKAGNKSDEASVEIVPDSGIKVTKIILDREHIAYNDTNKTINVTVYGSNFDLISSQSDTSFKIQIVDSSNNVSNFDANVDSSTNTATASITAPTLDKATAEGTDYTVRAKICGTIDTEHTATLNISTAAEVEFIGLPPPLNPISLMEITSGQTTTVTIYGTNLDLVHTITIQLYDSIGKPYGDASVMDILNTDGVHRNYKATIPIPTADDTYTLKVFLDGTIQNVSETWKIYGSPSFKSFKIPKAGISKGDNTVTATVVGKNFTASDVTEDSFTVSCSTASITNNYKVTILNDLMLSVTLKIPGKTGNYTVTIERDGESCTGTFIVNDYSLYEVGNIILADGTVVDSSSYSAIDTSKAPIAVVAGFNDNGAAIGIGLHTKKRLSWAKDGTTGYKTNFKDIICTPNKTGEKVAGAAEFTGDKDGSNNWDVICSFDSAGSADAAENYPAFNYANTYGETYKDYLENFIDGWYIPSLAELCYVYRNSENINTAMKKISNLKNGSDYADSNVFSIGSSFWSSSQSSYGAEYARYVNLYNGTIDNTFQKRDLPGVLVIREL